MITKVLIANRGEIASRIIRACQSLNVKTVAIYSEADKHSPYVSEADESYSIGPAPVQQSYLNMDAIFNVAKQANVDAIHPGYGFFSESGQFAERCEQEQIKFIGPSATVLQQMGNKVYARKVMRKHNIPIIPGSLDPVNTAEEAEKIAEEIGYPVMVKAAAGGGGVGMEVAENNVELHKQFADLSKRAQMYFGDGTMFIEKTIKNARHIEVQLLADEKGNIVHLFDRECSIQRRHQKVIEETPAPSLSKETREQMYEAAIKAAKAIQYTNAGTVEFLVDEEENFYFLEMNTRIQVEHPITEQITNIDIVAEQIKIANGTKLSYTQGDVEQQGHSLQCRLYAEDPKTFFPSPGKIKSFNLPKDDRIRQELTVKEGMEVTPFYDPMIGKIIFTEVTREKTLKKASKYLQQCSITGIKTNIPFLQFVLNDETFINGSYSISFVEKQYFKK